jgi:biotin carboxyl carrier protein
MNRTLMTRVAIGVLVVVAVGAFLWAVFAGLRGHDAKDILPRSAGARGRAAVVEGPTGDEATVTLQAPGRSRAGIITHALGMASRAGEVRLTGELIADPGRTTTVQAPVAGRLLVVDSARWPALGQQVNAGAVLGQISDAKPLTAPRGGIVTRVDAQPGQVVQPGQALLELTDFAEPLVRVVWGADAPLPAPKTLAIGPLVTATVGPAVPRAVRAQLIGAASGVDSLTRFPVYLYRAAHTWPGSGPGTPVIAIVAATSPATRGVFVPNDAAVQWEGLMWVYVERRDSRYVRVPLDTSHPVDGGWLVTGGDRRAALVGGDRVVVRGAQQLLSEEFRSRATVGDQSDEGDKK